MGSIAKSPLAEGTIDLPRRDETYVYRVYCRCGTLLYVGMTSDLIHRFHGHQRSAARWLHKARRIEWKLYQRRSIAGRAEQRAITRERPLYNQRPSGRPSRPVPLPWPRFLTDADEHQRAICAFRGESFLAWLFAAESWGRAA